MIQETSNPFDDPDATFRALKNTDGKYSLWPDFAPIPQGWMVTFGPNTRTACLDHIAAHWTGLHPRTLLQAAQQQEL